MTAVACTYRRCRTPATRHITIGPATWHGCNEHWPDMADAMHYGQGMDANVTVAIIEEPT